MAREEPQQPVVCSAEDEAVRVALRRQREHFQRIVDWNERERRLIAEQLIDAAADALVMTQPALPGEIEEPEDERVLTVRSVLAELLHRFGAIAGRLHPSLLEDAGLAAALEQLAEEIGELTLRPVAVTVDPGCLHGLPADVALGVHRVVEDIVSATVGPLRIRLRCAPPGWMELVAVAGEGGVSGHVVDPRPLALARARVDLLGGTLSTSTPRGGGLLLHAELPIAA